MRCTENHNHPKRSTTMSTHWRGGEATTEVNTTVKAKVMCISTIQCHLAGYPLALHTGTSMGYGALLTLVPDLNIGIQTSITGILSYLKVVPLYFLSFEHAWFFRARFRLPSETSSPSLHYRPSCQLRSISKCFQRLLLSRRISSSKAKQTTNSGRERKHKY